MTSRNLTGGAIAPPIAPGKLRRRLRTATPYLLPAIPFAVLIAVWLVSWQVFRPNLATLASVGEVIGAIGELAGNGELWANTLASVGRWALGFGIGVVSGVVLGVLAGLNARVARALEPPAAFFSAMSGIAWIPIAILWFGIGTLTVVFVIWNTVFFLVFAKTLLGVRSVQPVLEDAVRTMGGGRLHIVCRVTLLGALPHIVSGLRAGSGFGWRALIAAEIIGSTVGLGAMIYEAKEFFRTDIILAGILVIAVVALLIDACILGPLERRTIMRWNLITRDGGASR